MDEHSIGERALIKKNQSGLVTLTSAILQLEKRLGSDHAFLEAARSKVVHTLRRYGYWKEADVVLARRNVLTRLFKVLDELKGSHQSAKT